MKTPITKLGLALLTCVFALSSCTKNEKPDPTPTPTPDPKPVTATVTYTMPDRYDLITYADITVKYTDATGKEVSEVVKTATWEKVITNAPVPGTYKMSVSYTRNSTALDKNEYKCGIGALIAYTTPNSTHSAGTATVYDVVLKANMDECFKTINEIDNNSVEITD